jgi:hypothetical protein
LIGPQIKNHFARLEGELNKREWFAGADFGRRHPDELPRQGGGGLVP